MSDEINEIPEEHSDYKPADARDENVKHQLTGMYQNWFLDYASYVILERAVPPYQRRFETCATPYPAFYETSGRRAI